MKKIFRFLAFIGLTFLCITGCSSCGGGNTNVPDPVDNTYYQIDWCNYDGALLYRDDSVKKGTLPEYKGDTPVKPSDENFDYVFSGWYPEVKKAYSNATYTAQFSEEERGFTITWKNYDGTILEIDKNVEYGEFPTYDGSTPTKPSSELYRFDFSGWSPTVESVTSDATYTATFSRARIEYTITWENYDGSVLYRDGSVKGGTIPSYKGPTPTKPSDGEYAYSFSGWYPEVTEAHSDATYTAQYSKARNYYTITWKNYDGTVLETDKNVEYGMYPSYDGPTPTKPSSGDYRFVFSGWTPEIKSVTADATYTALFETTTGFSVTWKDYNGDILELDLNVKKGSMPTYDGPTPVRPSDETYNYTFDGWQPTVVPVTSDAEYTAKYIAKAKPTDVKSISFGQQDVYLFVGETASFSYTVNPSKYTNTVVFRSYDPSIADVSGTTIIGNSSGTTKIIGFGPNGVKSTFNVYVIQKMSLTLSGADAYYGCVLAATNSNFYLIGDGEDRPSRIYYAENYTETTKKAYKLKFYSTDTSYFEVDEITGLVKCKDKTGIVYCNAILSSPISSTSLRFQIGIRAGVHVTSWTFQNTSYSLAVGETTTIKATYAPSDANIGGLTYKSSDEKIATVDFNGKIRAINVGNCSIIIECSSLNKTYYLSVTVTGVYATSISAPASLSISPSQTKTISLSYLPSGANTGKRVTYFSDNEQVAFVDNKGHVTGFGAGNCKITITLENEYKTYVNVTVTEPVYPSSIALSDSTLELKPNQTKTLTATVEPSNANVFLTKTWTTSDPSVVAVSNGKIKAVAPGKAEVCVSLQNGVKAYCAVSVRDYIVPISVSLSETSITLDPLSTKTITAKINPSDADKDTNITWSSTNESVAKVKDGVITGVTPGNCKIKATLENGVFAYCDVTVNDYTYPLSLSLTPESVTVDSNRSTVVVPTISPSNANAGLNITWTSSNKRVATVDGGVITGVTPGTCTVKATLSNGVSAVCSVTVNDYIYAETIELSQSSITLTKDSSTVLAATYSPATANAGTKVTFKSTDSTIATVDNSGVITAKSVGTCSITATLENGYKKTCYVTVNNYIYAQTITLSKTSLTIKPNQSFQLNYTISPSDSQKGMKVTWSSNDNSVATVSPEGVVKGIEKGSCVITAILENGYAATCSVTVNGVPPIIFNAETRENYSNSLQINCTEGESLQLDSNTQVTYSSSNSSIAYVNSSNRLVARNAGTCVLTAKNSSGDVSEIAVNVYDCSISYQKETHIENYEYADDGLADFEERKTISELDVKIEDYSFTNGKTLNLTFSVNKVSGGFEESYIGIEIYDKSDNLLCVEVAKSDEQMLFGETKTITKAIDLSDFFPDSFTYGFKVKIVDSPMAL